MSMIKQLKMMEIQWMWVNYSIYFILIVDSTTEQIQMNENEVCIDHSTVYIEGNTHKS